MKGKNNKNNEIVEKSDEEEEKEDKEYFYEEDIEKIINSNNIINNEELNINLSSPIPNFPNQYNNNPYMPFQPFGFPNPNPYPNPYPKPIPGPIPRFQYKKDRKRSFLLFCNYFLQYIFSISSV